MDATWDAARAIVERIVWCTVATAGPDGEVRTRLMHPVWWWSGDDGVPFALVSARRATPVKERHLAANPIVSCFYWDPAHDTVAIDATARWVEGGARAAAWEAVKGVAPPVGFDPAMIWPDGPTDPGCGFLRFEAHRLVVAPVGQPKLHWRA